MNHKLKMKLVALLATLSGSALGTCQAMQVDTYSANPVGSGVARPAESTYDGAFGTVKVVLPPIVHARSNRELPPIVSPGNAGNDSAQQPPIVLPPIVTPFKPNGAVEPEFSQQDGSQQELSGGQSEIYSPAKSRNMLSPLSPMTSINQTVDLPTAATSMDYAPAPVIQAATATDAVEPGAVVRHATKWSSPVHPAHRVSAAGIPIYSEPDQVGLAAHQDQYPPIVQGQNASPSVAVPSIAPGNHSRPLPPVISARSQVVSPMNTLQALAPTRTRSAPIPMMPTQIPMSSEPTRKISGPMRARSPQVPMTQAPDMTMDSVMSSPGRIDEGQTYFSNPPMEPAVIGSSSSACIGCGGGGCPECGVAGTSAGDCAGCQSCGPGGCFNGANIENQFNDCGSVAYARRYLTVDMLYLDRDDGTIAVSNFGGLGDFDDDLFGARVTFGNREDSTNGREFVYFGSAKMSQSATHTDPLGRISAGYGTNPLDPFRSETSAFRDAVEQSQFKETTFQSIEFNKNDWGWDVMRTFVGMRYIYVQDDFELNSRNLLNETGRFQLQTQNNLLGVQTGYELFYDVGYRLSASTVGKFGLFANPNQVKTKLFNAGAQFLDLADTNTAFSGVIELGLHGQYKLSQGARFRFGYTALFLSQVSGVSDNVPFFISPTTGTDTSDSGQMFFHGLSVGFEIFR